MARPLKTTVSSQLAAWDAPVDANFTKIMQAPFPIHENASLTEANLQTTFPAASHDRCAVWVNHSVIGYTLYVSDGATWIPYGTERRPKRSVGATTTQVVSDKIVRFTGAGAFDYDFLTASAWKGQSVTIINDTSGNVNLDPNSTELIDGSSTSQVLAAGGRKTIYSDGTDLYTL
jgi:hypothetical protein